MSEETQVAAKAAPIVTIHVSDDHPMKGLVDGIATPPGNGDIVEGAIIAISRGRVYVDPAVWYGYYLRSRIPKRR